MIVLITSPLFSQSQDLFISVKADGMQKDAPANYGYALAEKAVDGSNAYTATLGVINPWGGETWGANTTKKLTWWYTGSIANVKLEYSLNNGSTWTTIVDSTSNPVREYNWYIPDVSSTQCLIRVSDVDGPAFAVTPSVFTIVGKPILLVPNGGELWARNEVHKIEWIAVGDPSGVRLEYSADGGGAWNTIYNGVLGTVYLWNIPDNVSANCLVRVSCAGGTLSDTSDGTFSILKNTLMRVVIPNGGESYVTGSIQKVKWISSNTYTSKYVHIRFSTDNGATWGPHKKVLNRGYYDSMIPNVPSDQCLVKISEMDGFPSDVSDNVFSIVPGKYIEVALPNGGETLTVGTPYRILWNYSLAIRNVKIEYSIDNGSTWSTIATTTNKGDYTWTPPNTPSTACLVRVSDADGKDSDTSDNVFEIKGVPVPAEIKVNRDKINFGAEKASAAQSESLLIENRGGETLNWSASVDVSWLTVTPDSGTNSGNITVTMDPTDMDAGDYQGSIVFSDANASNSPVTVVVNLTIYKPGKSAKPFGVFSTPLDDAVVSGSVPFTGWALDDIGVDSVKLYRIENKTDIFVGDALFVEGARPDVEAQYPDYPKAYQAGWGYMMLTHFLPEGGNGTYTFKAVALDMEGNLITLGTKSIICDNANATKPFGALDSPAPGGTMSGISALVQGWALTPPPNNIALDGSSIDVYVDGLFLGHPTYNIFRADIASLFPGYLNSQGAHGYFYLDTTLFENGTHTIQWVAGDDAGNSDGIGSRYFNILNTINPGSASGHFNISRIDDLEKIPIDNVSIVKARKGYRAKTLDTIADHDGILYTRELQRVEIQFTEDAAGIIGYMRVGQEFKSLPIGSSITDKIFSWVPGLGFNGDYPLIFILEKADGKVTRQHILIRIKAK
jgi:hypothetical protein